MENARTAQPKTIGQNSPTLYTGKSVFYYHALAAQCGVFTLLIRRQFRLRLAFVWQLKPRSAQKAQICKNDSQDEFPKLIFVRQFFIVHAAIGCTANPQNPLLLVNQRQHFLRVALFFCHCTETSVYPRFSTALYHILSHI